MQPLILFDFDGTLADSLDAFVHAVNDVVAERGLGAPLRAEELRDVPLHSLIRRYGIPFWRVPGVVEEFYRAYRTHIPELRFHPGMHGLASRLSRVVQLGIVSSNQPDVLSAFIAQEHLGSLFPTVDGGSFFAKNRHISRVRKRLGVPRSHTLYVGDEPRDVHAARRAGVASLAVTWGLSSEAPLLRVRPTFLARSVSEAEELLTAWVASRA